MKGIMKKSNLDYMITFGINNYNFQILDKIVITDHKGLNIKFLRNTYHFSILCL